MICWNQRILRFSARCKKPVSDCRAQRDSYQIELLLCKDRAELVTELHCVVSEERPPQLLEGPLDNLTVIHDDAQLLLQTLHQLLSLRQVWHWLLLWGAWVARRGRDRIWINGVNINDFDDRLAEIHFGGPCSPAHGQLPRRELPARHPINTLTVRPWIDAHLSLLLRRCINRELPGSDLRPAWPKVAIL